MRRRTSGAVAGVGNGGRGRGRGVRVCPGLDALQDVERQGEHACMRKAQGAICCVGAKHELCVVSPPAARQTRRPLGTTRRPLSSTWALRRSSGPAVRPAERSVTQCPGPVRATSAVPGPQPRIFARPSHRPPRAVEAPGDRHGAPVTGLEAHDRARGRGRANRGMRALVERRGRDRQRRVLVGDGGPQPGHAVAVSDVGGVGHPRTRPGIASGRNRGVRRVQWAATGGSAVLGGARVSEGRRFRGAFPVGGVGGGT